MNKKRSIQSNSGRSLKKQLRKLSQKVEQSPGEGRYYGDSLLSAFDAQLFSFNEELCTRIKVESAETIPSVSAEKRHWLQIKGLTCVEPIERICQSFHLHPLSIEDIFNTYHSAKFEEFSDYLLLISKYFHYNSSTRHIESHQITFVLKENLILTFQDSELTLFDPIISRIESGLGRVRKMPLDYLFYRLIDLLMDHNLKTIDAIWEAVDELDQSIMKSPDKQLAAEIQHLKREMILFMKALRPLRQSISAVMQSQTPFFHDETRLFFRDLLDHITELYDLSEMLNSYLIESFNLYLSFLGQKTNEVMKVLTAIATIFIPLTFIVGVYGMNFRFMPELALPYAYPLLWVIMIGISLAMVVYFRRNKWF